MDYTLSSDFFTHTGTGQRMHREDQAVPTALSDKDINSLMWSVMEVIKAAGLAGVQFDPSVPSTYRVLLTAIQNIYQAQTSDLPGRVAMFMQPTAPLGWVDPVGQLLSRTTYASLWTHIQTVGAVSDTAWMAGMSGWFSAGDGSTTFRMPDFRSVSFRALDAGRGIDIGRVLGSLQQPQNLAHVHSVIVDAVADHLHSVTVSAAGDHSHPITVDAGGAHTHPFNENISNATGAGGSNVQGPAFTARTNNTDSAGNHAHSASAGNAGNHVHGATAGAGGSHTHTGTAQTAGGSDMRVLNVAMKFYMKY